MVKYIREYEELSNALIEMLQEVQIKTLEDDELDKLNIALESMAQEMDVLCDLITQYGGKV